MGISWPSILCPVNQIHNLLNTQAPPFHLFSDIISRTDSPFTILPKDSPNIASLIIAYFGEHLEKSLNECVRPLSISAFL